MAACWGVVPGVDNVGVVAVAAVVALADAGADCVAIDAVAGAACTVAAARGADARDRDGACDVAATPVACGELAGSHAAFKSRDDLVDWSADGAFAAYAATITAAGSGPASPAAVVRTAPAQASAVFNNDRRHSEIPIPGFMVASLQCQRHPGATRPEQPAAADQRRRRTGRLSRRAAGSRHEHSIGRNPQGGPSEKRPGFSRMSRADSRACPASSRAAVPRCGSRNLLPHPALISHRGVDETHVDAPEMAHGAISRTRPVFR